MGTGLSSDEKRTLIGTAVVPDPTGSSTGSSTGAAGQGQGAPVLPVAPSYAGEDPSGAAPTPARQPLPTTTIPIETLSGRFIWISLWRAFRLQIQSHEVLRSKRKTLVADAEHIVDPEQQAFLAWRRSVLLLVAIAFVPLTLLRPIEGFPGPPVPIVARMFLLLPAVAEALFRAIAFDQLRNWTKWKKQRRVIFMAWALCIFAPFLVYLYPFHSDLEGSIGLAPKATESVGVGLPFK
ncbi:MAG: hypothetical protein GY811_25840 [Myxococcales bacterium]|nr:hypothetical protein [Myxococcales bacterium]